MPQLQYHRLSDFVEILISEEIVTSFLAIKKNKNCIRKQRCLTINDGRKVLTSDRDFLIGKRNVINISCLL